jgi:hypothetical protein
MQIDWSKKEKHKRGIDIHEITCFFLYEKDKETTLAQIL